MAQQPRRSESDFHDFVVARSPALLRAAYLLVGDLGRAEDLVQTALARTWHRWARVNRDGTGEAYVRRVIYTSFASWWQRRWRGEIPAARLPDVADRRDLHAAVEERTVLLHALAGLTPGQRAVVVLRYYEDRSEAETAELLGISVGTVKSQAARALARLRTSPTLNALLEVSR